MKQCLIPVIKLCPELEFHSEFFRIVNFQSFSALSVSIRDKIQIQKVKFKVFLLDHIETLHHVNVEVIN